MSRRYRLAFVVAASAETAFSIFFSSREQALLTGEKADIAADVDRSFRLFGKRLRGKVRAVTPRASATLSVRTEGRRSKVLLSFLPLDADRSRLVIEHRRIAPEDVASYRKVWHTYRERFDAYLRKRHDHADEARRRLVSESKKLPAFLYPIEIFSRSRALVELPRTEALFRDIFALAEDPNNRHTRRVGLTAIRFAEEWDVPGLVELLVRRLSDEEGWVRYDAAWALGDSGTQDPAALAGLAELAKGAPENPDLSDADARARQQARESLDALRSRATSTA